MNTAEILSLVSLICYILSGVGLFMAVLFWFLFKIPAVIGGLSGRTARKSIERMRSANERSGSKSYRPSNVNVARGKVTDSMSGKGEKMADKKAATAQKQTAVAEQPETGLLAENKAGVVDSQQTELLTDDTMTLAGETADLDYEATGMLVDEDSTMPLNMPKQFASRVGGVKLTMLNEVMLIHTNEVIR